MSDSPQKSIFLEALEMEGDDRRRAYLDRACAGDERLRAEVEELLHAHEQPDNVLDGFPSDLVNPADQYGKVLRQQADVTTDFVPHPIAAPEAPGAVIGPYRLMEQIGEGGFGLVFVAEQQRPVRRKVALKVIKPGMDTRDVIARFEAERQALALMDHPNIARVFDAGATETGRPYFVMELVRGVPITDFCDQQQLDTRARLELFITVCNAVQHAHQKGVIHRDLKPSNVLVTSHDGVPVAKVIDFGVAKAIGQRLTDKTVYTRFAAMIGTPLYMSPEQAEMSGLDVDTRSDIYSLGVLLYTLLTGVTPYDTERMQQAGLDELRRIIREEEPPRPSTRLTTLGQTISTISSNRNAEPRRLSSYLQGDLDWIVMKAIEKDRTRRYETASALAEDVRRFLNQEPVEARPPSKLYRLRKYARRHKVTLSATFLVAAALVLGTGVSLWQAARALDESRQKEDALNEAVAARRDADAARKEVEEFAERLKQANLLLTSARAHADAGRWSAANDDYTRATELQPSYFIVWVERGAMYLRLGLWQLAAEDYAKALALGAPTEGPSWWGVAPLFQYTGREDLSRQLCAQIVGKRQVEELSLMDLRACLLAPRPKLDPEQLALQAERQLGMTFGGPPWDFGGPPPKGGDRPSRGRSPRRGRGPGGGPEPPDRDRPGQPFGGQGGPMPHGVPRHVAEFVAGWAHYRAEQYDLAIERLQQSVAPDNRSWPVPPGLERGWTGLPSSQLLLAMSYQRNGQGEEARQALSDAQQSMDQQIKQMAQWPLGYFPMVWFDWIECLVLHREASILITGFAPADDPRLRTIQQRALDELQNGSAQ